MRRPEGAVLLLNGDYVFPIDKVEIAVKSPHYLNYFKTAPYTPVISDPKH